MDAPWAHGLVLMAVSLGIVVAFLGIARTVGELLTPERRRRLGECPTCSGSHERWELTDFGKLRRAEVSMCPVRLRVVLARSAAFERSRPADPPEPPPAVRSSLRDPPARAPAEPA